MVALVRLVVLLALALLLPACLPAASAQTMRDRYEDEERWVEATLSVTQPDLMTMLIAGELIVRKFVVEGTPYESADDIGGAYHDLRRADETAAANGQAGGRADAFVADMEAEASAAVRSMLQEAFPQATVSIESVTLDRETLESPDERPFEPGIAIALAASVKRTAEDVGLGTATQEDVDTLFDAGAAVVAEMRFVPKAGYDVTQEIAPPPGAVFAAAQGGVIDASGHLVVDVPGDGGDVPVSVTLRGAGAPVFDAADAAVAIKVDLQDLDVTIGKAMAGDFGNLIAQLTVDAQMGVIEMPDSLAGGFPSSVRFDYISADAIRLLRERGKLSDADLMSMEESLLRRVSDQLGAALGGDIAVAGGFARDSFASSLMSSPLSGENPLVFQASASIVKPLSGGELQAGAAIALYTTELPLSLPKVQGLDTTYTVVLPRGLAVTGLSAQGGESEAGKAPDGRDQFTVTPTGERADVTATMAVTPTFVLVKFWPVVLLAVLLLVLIVGTPVALVMRRRRRKA